jgi:branched-chain amino acid transport system permease protein
VNLLQTLLDALSLGAIYALAALGVGLIFSVMRLINFAHGELITTAGFTAYALGSEPLPVRLSGALAAAVVLALVMERIAFRPIRRASSSTLLVTSFAVSYLLQHVIVLIFGARPLGVSLLPGLAESLAIPGGLRVPRLEIATIGSTLVLLAGLLAFFYRTSIGIQMRAAAEDFTTARLVGIRANRVIAMAFAISGLLAAFLGIYEAAQSGTVSYRMGVDLVLIAFVASVVGGMGSLAGAALGGLVVGVISIGLQAFLPEGWRAYRDAFLFGLFLLFLIGRPEGLLFRRYQRERV